MKSVEALLARGVAERVFPTARAEVWHRGARVFAGGTPEPAGRPFQFDVASLTKVLVTTPVAMQLAAAGAFKLEATVRSVLPAAVAPEVTFEDLLFHRSGLPGWKPLFAEVMRAQPELFTPDAPEAARQSARTALVSAALKLRSTGWRCERAEYSDIGFLLLGAALEKATGAELPELFTRLVTTPLQLTHPGAPAFHPLARRSAWSPDDSPPTGTTRPRPPAPGQEGSFTLEERPSAPGEVDDDNAWAMNGVAPHAGLFASAGDVAAIGQAILAGWIRPERGWGPDAQTPESSRTLGFDTPFSEAPSCGKRFGRGEKGGIGHTGFTGCSLWIDFTRELVVVLLTNRVALGRANRAIISFRPVFHDAVLDELSR